MEYNEGELRRFNIMQLREIGKGMNIKGVTNKDKSELISDILRNQFGVVDKRTSVQNIENSEFYQQLKAVFLPVYENKNAQGGFCLVDNDKFFSRVCNEYGVLFDVFLPRFIIERNRIQDGDYILFRQATYENINYVESIVSINDNLEICETTSPLRQIKIVENTQDTIIQMAKSIKNAIVITPLYSYDKIKILDDNNINHMSSSMDKSNSEQGLFVRLCLPRVLKKVREGFIINALVDLDTLYLGFLTTQNENIAKVSLAKFFCKAVAFKNKGQLNIIFITQNKELSSMLQTYSSIEKECEVL